MSVSNKWGFYSLGIFLLLSLFGLINYSLLKFDLIGNNDLLESLFFAFFNVSWGLYTLFATFFKMTYFSSTIQKFFLFFFCWVLGGLIWFFVGKFLGNLIKNKKSPKDKLIYLGKFLMKWSVLVYLPIEIILLIIDVVTNNQEWPISLIIGGLFLLPFFGMFFVLGLILWIISKLKNH